MEVPLLFYSYRNDGIKALVTTGHDKFYSNGLDLPEMMNSTDGGQNFLRSFQKVLNKILVFPKPTIAAINGLVIMINDYNTHAIILYRSCICCRRHDGINT